LRSFFPVALPIVIGFVLGVAPLGRSAWGGETTADVTVRKWPALEAPAVGELRAGVAVTARGHWRGWVSIAGPARGWIPLSSYSRSDPSTSSGAAPAGASASTTAAAPATPPAAGERTEGDLMFDAINSTRGETPNAAKIARVIADANAEVKRKDEVTRKRKVAAMAAYWKDPFADDPDKLIPIRPRRGGKDVSANREAARARAETAAARADAAAARAEAAKAKADAAKAEASAARADALAAKREAQSARAGCADPTATRAVALARGAGARERTGNAPPPERDRPRVVRTPARRIHALQVAIAQSEHADKPAPPSPPSAPAEEPAPPPPSARSTDPRGIVIVPINTAPAAPAAH